jgi:hypothetical protein
MQIGNDEPKTTVEKCLKEYKLQFNITIYYAMAMDEYVGKVVVE